MGTITLNTKRIYEKNSTSKYWRDIECLPQTVELKSWGINNPLFYLKGVIVNSHDEKEIGKETECLIQTYSFYIEDLVKEGVYTIN